MSQDVPEVESLKLMVTLLLLTDSTPSSIGVSVNPGSLGVGDAAGWLNEPNCQMCHQNGTTYTSAFTGTDLGPNGTQRGSSDATFATTANVPANGYSLYRFSLGHGSTECQACHGSPHAEYPTNQANDNV